MNTNRLYSEVTQAIWGAEELQRSGKDSRSKWLRVSALEDQIAMKCSVSDAERRIARRGAVSAALKAEDYKKAERFVEKYATGISKRHYRELQSILHEADKK